jgi:integrase
MPRRRGGRAIRVTPAMKAITGRSMIFSDRDGPLISAFQGDDELVFCHPQKGAPIDPARLAREHLRPALHAAAISKPFRPFHDLRHTALTHDAAAGNPLAYIQQRAGHSQTSITERYIHAAQVQFRGAAERAEARMFNSPPLEAPPS